MQVAPRVAPLAAQAISAAEGSATVVGGTAVASAVASAAATLGITKRAEKEQQVGLACTRFAPPRPRRCKERFPVAILPCLCPVDPTAAARSAEVSRSMLIYTGVQKQTQQLLPHLRCCLPQARQRTRLEKLRTCESPPELQLLLSY